MRLLGYLVCLFSASLLIGGCNETALGGGNRGVCPKDCVGATPHCHPELLQCSQCVKDNDCESDESCTSGTGACVDRDLMRINIDDAAIVESAGMLEIPVRLSRTNANIAIEVRVNYATQSTNGNAAAAVGDDYNETHGSLIFGASEVSKTISIPIANDDIHEIDETFLVVLSAPSAAAILDDDSAIATIDNDDLLVITANDQSADEGAGNLVFPVMLSRESSQTITLNYKTLDGTSQTGSAIHDEDYTAVSGSITFQPGEISKSIPVPLIDNLNPELPKVFTLELSWPNNEIIRTVTGTINNDDGLHVSIADVSQPEHGVRLIFNVTLSAPSEQEVKVNYQTQNNTAIAGAGADYTAGNGTLTFAPGNIQQQIQVPIHDDNRDEDDERFFVELSNPTNSELGDALASGEIVDNDSPPTISIANSSRAENAGPVVFSVSSSAPSGKMMSVTYHTANGSALAGVGADYSAASGTLVFAPDQTSKTISVEISDDSLDEVDETFNLILDAASNAELGTTTATGTITDNDNPPTISIADASALESAANMSFNVTLSAPSSKSVSVTYATSNGTASAGASGDYTAVAATVLTFAPGETLKPISVPLREDALDEANETFTVTLTSPGNATIADNSATGTITDNDNAPTASIAAVSGLESATPMTFTVTLSSPSSLTSTVSYATSTGTAVSGSDYNSASGTLTFAPGDTSETFSVTILNDNLDEADETFNVTLSSPVNATLGTSYTATGTIQDNDNAPALSITNASAIEGNTITFSVSLSGASGQSVSVVYASAGGTAASGTDYTAANGTLTFAPNELSKLISVSTAHDTTDEIDETFSITLSAPSHATLGTSSATGTITDNDPGPSVSIAHASASETAGTLSMNVTLSAASAKTVTVNYATASNSATAGSDFTTSSGTLTFNPSETSKSIVVPLIDDSTSEASENFTVSLSTPTNATLGAMSSATGTITDNEGLPSLSIGNISAAENAGTMTFNVTLSAASAQTVNVGYATADGSAKTSGPDYTMASGTLTFAAGQISKQIAVSISNDALNEANETFTVTLMSPSNAVLGSASSATGTITDNDPLPSLSVANVSASENAGSITFTVTLSAASGRPVSVHYATNPGTATTSADFSSKTGTLTFSEGDTSETVSVFLTDDSVDEPNQETFTLALSTPNNAVLGAGTATATISDDDDAPTLSIFFLYEATTTFSEGSNPAPFFVNKIGSTDQTVTVNWTTSNGSASAGSDYVGASGTLTFLPGDESKPIDITQINDGADENDETYTVTLSSPSNAVLGTQSFTLTIIDNDFEPSISIGDATATENLANVTLPVTLSQASGKTISISYATSNVTVGNFAIAGTDYTAKTGTLTFAPGETVKNILVPILGDALVEPTENFAVTLSTPVDVFVLDGNATGSISNDDTGPSLSIGDAADVEGAGTLTFAVTMSPANNTQTVTVSYTTANGTALSGADYTAKSGTLTFAPGNTLQLISVTINNDTASEPSESFTLSLGTPINATLTDPIGTGTINNDDGFFAGVMDSGSDFNCALKTDNSLWCWGRNYGGTLGNGSGSGDLSTPTRAGTDVDWASLSAGGVHACAIKTNGTLWCWGFNPIGPGEHSPARVGVDSDWNSVSAGGSHTCAIKNNGTLWCWGINAYGQLGTGSTTEKSAPTLIGTSNEWISVAAGSHYTCGLRSQGTLWCWGSNASGELGIGSSATSVLVPTQVSSAIAWTSVSVSEEASAPGLTCGTKANGTVWCWGSNGWGQLGTGGTGSNVTSPVQTGSSTTWVAVEVGTMFACGLQASGTASNHQLWCWGVNNQSQLGTGSSATNLATPTRVGTASDWSQITLGSSHACALKANGKAFSWGDNYYGQLGNGTMGGQVTAPGQVN